MYRNKTDEIIIFGALAFCSIVLIFMNNLEENLDK
jgi:hypothetical protein